MKRYLLILVVVFILGSFNVYSQASQCTDSDGKIDIYTKGLTKGLEIETSDSVYLTEWLENRTSGPISREDYCSGPNIVVEYFCCARNESGECYYMDSAKYDCPNGCRDGVCLLEKTLKPTIIVISPNGGEILQVGNVYTIEWKSVDVPLDGPDAQVSLYLINRNNGQKTLIADYLPRTGTYNWNMPTTTQKGNFVIYIEYLFAFTNNIISDESNQIFTIVSDSKCGNGICDQDEETICPSDCTASPTCPINCECDQKGNVIACSLIECPVGCSCDEKGNVLECSTSKPCPANCNCDSQGNIISCVTLPQCPANCNCDEKGNVIDCSIKISCPSKCKCDSSGNILDCEKSECIDSDGGKNYYEKGKVFVPHSDATYTDECANEKKGYETYDHNLLFEAYCFVDKYGYGYDYYLCPNGCKDGACAPFYEEIEEMQAKIEKSDSSSECPNEICKEISKKCIGSDKIVIEQCTFYVKSNNKCEEITNTNSRILKGECGKEEANQVVTFCQGCQLDESTCIPFGTRLEKKDSAYYCDITKKMVEQKENKISCQNSYECLSNNCKSGSCTSICEGCLNENKACVPVGTRTSTQFCDSDYSFKNQNSEDNDCNNNYECSSNVCVNNKCISPSLIQRIIEWFKKLFG